MITKPQDYNDIRANSFGYMYNN